MNRIWWLHPGKLILLFILPIYAFLVYVVPKRWPQLLVLKGADYVVGDYAAMGFVMVATLGAFAMLGSRISVGRAVPAGHLVNPRKLFAVAAVAAVAYVIWFFPVIAHGRIGLEREELNRMAGVTSFTQLGVAFLLCYVQCRTAGRQLFPRYLRFALVAIIALVLFRVFVWSERLAAIETAVPAAVVLLSNARPERKLGRTLLRAVAIGGPFLAIPILVFVFGFTEYFRSWQTYAHTQSLPLVDFMVRRIASYYFTALNNGAGMLATAPDDWPTYKGFFVANWAYHLPLGIGDSLRAMGIGSSPDPDEVFLMNYADVEFNNMSGVFTVVYDLGTVGGLFYFALFGFTAGMLYRSMLRGSRVGGMLYPPVFIGCLEVLRVPYLNGPRVVLIFAGAWFLLSQMRRRVVPADATDSPSESDLRRPKGADLVSGYRSRTNFSS